MSYQQSWNDQRGTYQTGCHRYRGNLCKEQGAPRARSSKKNETGGHGKSQRRETRRGNPSSSDSESSSSSTESSSDKKGKKKEQTKKKKKKDKKNKMSRRRKENTTCSVRTEPAATEGASRVTRSNADRTANHTETETVTVCTT